MGRQAEFSFGRRGGIMLIALPLALVAAIGIVSLATGSRQGMAWRRDNRAARAGWMASDAAAAVAVGLLATDPGIEGWLTDPAAGPRTMDVGAVRGFLGRALGVDVVEVTARTRPHRTLFDATTGPVNFGAMELTVKVAPVARGGRPATLRSTWLWSRRVFDPAAVVAFSPRPARWEPLP